MINDIFQIDKVLSNIVDEESKDIFRARVNFSLTQDFFSFFGVVNKYVRGAVCKELKDYLEKNNTGNIVIYGAGKVGQTNLEILKSFNLDNHVVCFAESKRENSERVMQSYPILYVYEAIKKYKDAVWIISVWDEAAAKYMMATLKMLGVSRTNILYSSYNGILFGVSLEAQYFDVFEPTDEEVFVDAGACDGSTTMRFKKWSGKLDSKSYIFEPINEQFEWIKTRGTLGGLNLENVVLNNVAVWDKKEVLCFKNNVDGSRMNENGGEKVEADSLDNLVGTDKVTLLKMDIEGAELKALQGAENIIKRCKPRMAISLYHKNEDIFMIPAYILSLVPEYKFIIRHYSTFWFETVLYAYV